MVNEIYNLKKLAWNVKKQQGIIDKKRPISLVSAQNRVNYIYHLAKPMFMNEL